MDLKIKGKSWVGNIYNQFESICQDVDGFMTKDSVKYVENQVQSVGVSVKRFYSNVVQDILPPSRDNVKLKGNSVIVKQEVGMSDNVESVTSIGFTPICVVENRFCTEKGSVNTLRNTDAALPIELDHGMQFTRSPCADPSQNIITDVPLRKDGDSVILNDCDEKISYVPCDEDIKNSAFSVAPPALSVEDKEILANKNGRTILCNSLTECDYKISRTICLFKDDLPMIEDPNSNDITNLSAAPLDSAGKTHEEDNEVIYSPLSSECDEGERSSWEDGTLCDSFSTKVETLDVPSTVKSTGLVFTYFSCDDKQGDVGVTNSSSTSANFNENAENICSTHVDPNVCAYNGNDSTPSSTTTAYETKTMESNDNNSSVSHGSVSAVGSSNCEHELFHEDAQSKFEISPSQTDNSHESGVSVADLDMETVDLSTNVRHDERDLVLNCNLVHSASYRRKNFSYYKHLIHDAFASRKRLSKEYKHLAILYGDIDMESRQQFEPSSLCSSTSTSVNAPRTDEMSESEWELL
ncbi:hypothetical protein ACJIZ3_011152 [Penstemon smallii]|uniref:Uncharacterized protein n=1 Tax=Penstemon smallii TaxID=265156 RepID=A0ABD3UJT9_9LAMI